MLSCEDNEVLPDYEKVGTSTATVADISVSNAKPLPGEAIVVTINYVNLAEDPATEIELLAKVGSGNFGALTTLDESSAGISEEITRTYTYTVPDVEFGTVIILDMVLNSENSEFPQRERVTIEVTEEEETEA
ncbi:hypothetical protein [Catalinimonas niigatensis]|uniref:hypothetical protein n=1 Tax=Catalinimonas niigatensis TaxID=1397264 RepID=UPI0026667C25|nr:hypothetical protein [Catalinimonas niigatensis]WPP53243.1 hypothetical protein PZB72_12760 [Catalinimonas niigatensis]